LWPFPEKSLVKIAEQAKTIIVPEMNCGQMVREVERVAKETPVVFLSKLCEEPHTPLEILDTIRRSR
jgi:2-oxoglutarate ferredoxin oxidoreductase subunit alpha